jgi:hypothetical protein
MPTPPVAATTTAAGCEEVDLGNVLGGEAALPACMATFRQWHQCARAILHQKDGRGEAVAEGAFKVLVRDHVAEDVEFAPPTYFATYRGRGPFTAILLSVGKIFGDGFRYHRQVLCFRWW